MANNYEILLKIGGALEGSLGSAVSGASKSLQQVENVSGKASKGLNSLQGSTEKSSSVFRSMKSALIGAAAGIGVATSFKAIMDAASKSEQTTAQLQNVLKSTGGAAGVTQQAAENLASSLSSVTTFGKGTIIGSESLLLTFTKIGKDVMPQATETVLNMSQALGQDTKSSAIQLGKALNDPINGMTALQRVGVTFSAQQKQQIETMQKAGNVMGAQKIILSELNTEFGGSARAAGATFSGQIQIIKNNMAGVGASIGLALMPTIRMLLPSITAGMLSLSTFIKSNLGPAIQNIASIISSRVMPVIKTGFTDAGNIAKWFGDHLNLVIPIIKAVTVGLVAYKTAQLGLNAAEKVGMMISSLSKAWQTAGTVLTVLRNAENLAAGAQILLNAAWAASPVGVVTAGILLIVGAGVLLYKNWGTISKFLLGVWNGLKTVASNVFGAIGKFVTGIGEGIKNSLSNAWSSVASTVVSSWNGVKNFFSSIGKGIVSTAKSIGTGIVNAFSWMYNHNYYFKNLVDFIGKAWNTIKSTAISIWHSITSTLSGIWNGLVAVVSGVWNAIKQGVSTAWNAITSLLITLWNDEINGLKTIFGPIVNLLQGIWNSVSSAAATAWNAIKTTISSLSQSAVSSVTSVFGGIGSFFSGLATDAYNWGANLIKMIGKGITDTISNVKSAVTSVAQAIGSFLGFHSPAKEGPGSDADTWAPNLVNMFAGGIIGNIGAIKSSALKAIQPVKDAMGGVMGGNALTGSFTGSVTHNQAGGIMGYLNSRNNSSDSMPGEVSGTGGNNHYHYSPVYYFGSGTNVEDFKQADKQSQRDWEQRMKVWQTNQGRTKWT